MSVFPVSAVSIALLAAIASASSAVQEPVPAPQAPRTTTRTSIHGSAEGIPADSHPARLVGTWLCKKTAITEAAGPGATTVKLKPNGVYVISVKPADPKDRHIGKEYGTWAADETQFGRTSKWFQIDNDKLEPAQGLSLGGPYRLTQNGATLDLDGIVFKRVMGASSTTAKARPRHHRK
jgi:hypothetical protein